MQTTRLDIVMNTCGDLPPVGSDAPDFTLADATLDDLKLADFKDVTLGLNIFPSIDTPTCQKSVRQFNERLNALDGLQVLNVSVDLPFAQARFCAAEGLERVKNASAFRSPEFGQAYGVEIIDTQRRGLLARAVVVIRQGKVIFSELVKELTEEPNYEAVLAAAQA